MISECRGKVDTLRTIFTKNSRVIAVETIGKTSVSAHLTFGVPSSLRQIIVLDDVTFT